MDQVLLTESNTNTTNYSYFYCQWSQLTQLTIVSTISEEDNCPDDRTQQDITTVLMEPLPKKIKKKVT